MSANSFILNSGRSGRFPDEVGLRQRRFMSGVKVRPVARRSRGEADGFELPPRLVRSTCAVGSAWGAGSFATTSKPRASTGAGPAPPR